MLHSRAEGNKFVLNFHQGLTSFLNTDKLSYVDKNRLARVFTSLVANSQLWQTHKPIYLLYFVSVKAPSPLSQA